MSTAVEEILIVDEWCGLYSESWKTAWRPNLPRATKNRGMICDDAFSHPAKFSRALIRQIYDHVAEEGWATKGSSVIDPFGGVALGGFDAMRLGLNWYGCELEQKFVELGGKNIALWNERFSRMPNWGTARLIQGDSRKLANVLSEASCCVTSPPYANDTVNDRNGIDLSLIKKPGGHNSQSRKMSGYGEASGQLGAMKEGDHSIVISSPPYAGGCRQTGGQDPKPHYIQSGNKDVLREYGNTDGQLGAMPEGQLCVTSPPFESSTQVNNTPGDMTAGRARWEGGTDSAARVKQDYADYASPENLGNMRGGFQAAVSSPPYEGSLHDPSTSPQPRAGDVRKYARTPQEWDYGGARNNLGNQRGETFWSASRLILEQLHQVLAPNAHAVFVVKSFVRNKKIVDFPAQWAQLCEAVGFKLLHDHHALLIERGARQPAMDEFDIQGDTWRMVTRDKDHTVARKSFFRRLAESKGSPRIDHENVLCFESSKRI